MAFFVGIKKSAHVTQMSYWMYVSLFFFIFINIILGNRKRIFTTYVIAHKERKMP